MSEINTPTGTDLNTATNAIRDLMRPTEDNVTDTEAPEAEFDDQYSNDAEMSEEQEQSLELEDGSDDDYEADEQDDESFDILSAKIELDGEEITVEQLKSGYMMRKDYTRKTQELAEMRRQVEQMDQQLMERDAQYAQLLPALQERLMQQVEQEPDWDTLYETDPTMAARAERQWRKQQSERQAQLDAITAERQRMAQIEQQRREQMEARYFEEQRQMLPEIIPEWRDAKVASREARDIRNFLVREGFTEQDVNGLTNATLVKLARKAMLFDQGQTRATEAKQKPRKPKAKTLRAGSRGSQSVPKSEQDQAFQRLKKTGLERDAVSYIKTLL